MKNLIIREELTEDYHATEELTREAFWKFWETGRQISDEHLLVFKLRKILAFVPELNLVAELAGKLVGHIIYSVSKVVDDSGEAFEMLTFGPISVHPDKQNKGIGKALMRHSFKIAKDLGYRAVIIFGHPDFYPRVGFRRAAEFGITTSDGKNFDSFMAYPLFEGALDGIHGRYYIDPVYESLTQEEALEFDKKFPFKEPHKLTPVDVLLNRLNSPAKEAMKKLNLSSLNMMTTQSQREISTLEGIDAQALETIHTVMREHGLRWGVRSPVIVDLTRNLSLL